MDKSNMHNGRTMTGNQNHARRRTAPAGAWHFTVTAVISALLFIAALIPAAGHALTLDEAVTEQLARRNDTSCFELLGNGGTPEPGSGLDTICQDRGGSNPSSSSSGGGAGTPASIPGIVQKRMQEKEEEEKSVGDTDAVVKLRKGLSLFISGEYEELDRDVSTFEDGYDSDIGRLIVGADYQITERILAGLAFDTSRHNGDFDSGGSFDTKTYGIVLFGSFIPVRNAFLQIYGGYSEQSTDRQRTASFSEPDNFLLVTGSPDSDFDADLYSAGVMIGYDHPVGSVTISPRAGLDWLETEFDTYSETDSSGLALTFHDDEVTSLLASLGLQASTAISAAFGVVIPQASIYWKHEYDQDQRDVSVSFVEDTSSTKFTYETESPDRDYYELNAGVSLVLPGGVQTFINYRTLIDHKFLNSHAGSIGLRVEL